MKNFLRMTAIFIIIISVFSIPSSIAESISVSELTDEELLLLKDEVETEIASRDLSDLSVLPGGVYIVGEDIKSGSYKVIGKSRQSRIYVFTEKSYDAYVRNGSWEAPEAKPNVQLFIDPGQEGFIGAREGEIIYVIYDCYIEEIDEPWMP